MSKEGPSHEDDVLKTLSPDTWYESHDADVDTDTDDSGEESEQEQETDDA